MQFEREPPPQGLWQKIVTGIQVVGNTIMAAAEKVVEAIDVVYTADVLARRYNWCLSATWPMDLMRDIGELARWDGCAPLIESRLLMFYSENDWSKLVELVEDTSRFRSVSKRRAQRFLEVPLVVRAAAEKGFDAPSFILPLLFSELEGVLRDAHDNNIITIASGKGFSVPNSLRDLRVVAAPIEKPGLRLIARKFYKNDRGRKLTRARSIHRHAWMHGKIKGPARITDVVRVLLMINLLAFLIDVCEDEEADHLQQRRAITFILSYTVRIGRALSATKRKLAIANETSQKMLPPAVS